MTSNLVVRYSHKHYAVIDKTRAPDDDMRPDDMTTTTPEYRHVISSGSATSGLCVDTETSLGRPQPRQQQQQPSQSASPSLAAGSAVNSAENVDPHKACGFRCRRMHEHTATNARQHVACQFACVFTTAQIALCANKMDLGSTKSSLTWRFLESCTRVCRTSADDAK